jgi:hypothetical protein
MLYQQYPSFSVRIVCIFLEKHHINLENSHVLVKFSLCLNLKLIFKYFFLIANCNSCRSWISLCLLRSYEALDLILLLPFMHQYCSLEKYWIATALREPIRRRYTVTWRHIWTHWAMHLGCSILVLLREINEIGAKICNLKSFLRSSDVYKGLYKIEWSSLLWMSYFYLG